MHERVWRYFVFIYLQVVHPRRGERRRKKKARVVARKSTASSLLRVQGCRLSEESSELFASNLGRRALLLKKNVDANPSKGSCLREGSEKASYTAVAVKHLETRYMRSRPTTRNLWRK